MDCLDSHLAKFDILFLKLGSNDLCDQTLDPQKFVKDLLSYASYLIVGLEIRLVAISHIIVRQKEPFLGYNQKVHLLNVLLKSELASKHPMIYFWRHTAGLWRADPDIVMADGVHLSWHE